MISKRRQISGKIFFMSLLLCFSIFLHNINAEEPFKLPSLPYAENALEPVISAKTISFHYGKHHKGYVDNLNRLIKGTPLAAKSLEEIIKSTAGKRGQASIFNNAAQVWNHNFFWQSLQPIKELAIPDTIKSLISSSFGDYEAFKKAFADSAVSQFGSGYAWLVKDGDKLKIVKTGNAETPITQGLVPLLTIDIWEHAYYLDYQNKRIDYANSIIDKMLNWDFAVKNLSQVALPKK